ncbi:peroxisomal multifunctional enzyme type 2-like [Glossina fuscipes]|uniref:Peroxisomal multifunctional enzyme type 2-like n=1 Tax=Glossina fuscipes TaxID=7396 RepID=A0A8U0WFF1_9MUSC|nr:peroxisomal multifunctional enzyme type 2-like [Glossina fuscipes]
MVDRAKIVETAIKNFGCVDIATNNAGISRDRSIPKISERDWDFVHHVRLKGTFKDTLAAWLHMKKQNYGRIFITSSDSGMYGNFGQASCSAPKMVLIRSVNTVAIEEEKYNIHCNVIIHPAANRLIQDILII